MKPKPFVALNHFTVPVAIAISPWGGYSSAAGARPRVSPSLAESLLALRESHVTRDANSTSRMGFSGTRRGDKYAKFGRRLRLRNVVPRTHDFEGPVAEAHDISKAQAQAILDSLLKSIVNAAASDHEVSLAGFGKFKVKASPEREGRNPANAEKIKIAASKKLSFSPAKAVKDVLNA
jgi:DNA-binding protein HU-beta